MVGSSLTLLAGSSMAIDNLQQLWMFGGLNLEINKLVDCLYSFKNVFGKGQGKVECHCYPGPLREAFKKKRPEKLKYFNLGGGGKIF